MPYSSGVFSLYSTGNPVVTGTVISSTWANNTLDDIANNGLSVCLLKDGSQTATASIPFDAGADMNGTELILDADGDTSITADTDDQVDVKVAGSDIGAFGVWGWATTVAAGLTAATGSSQGDGPVTANVNVYTTVGTAGDCCTLPATFLAGTAITVRNDSGGNAMDVFPATGDDLGAGTNTAQSISNNRSITFIATVADTTWIQLKDQ